MIIQVTLLSITRVRSSMEYALLPKFHGVYFTT